jgi:hypothetical protein
MIDLHLRIHCLNRILVDIKNHCISICSLKQALIRAQHQVKSLNYEFLDVISACSCLIISVLPGEEV